MAIVNFELIKHPVNWLTVLSMVLIFGFLAHLILTHFKPETMVPVSAAAAGTTGQTSL